MEKNKFKALKYFLRMKYREQIHHIRSYMHGPELGQNRKFKKIDKLKKLDSPKKEKVHGEITETKYTLFGNVTSVLQHFRPNIIGPTPAVGRMYIQFC